MLLKNVQVVNAKESPQALSVFMAGKYKKQTSAWLSFSYSNRPLWVSIFHVILLWTEGQNVIQGDTSKSQDDFSE